MNFARIMVTASRYAPPVAALVADAISKQNPQRVPDQHRAGDAGGRCMGNR
jgi:hypothetical protein